MGFFEKSLVEFLNPVPDENPGGISGRIPGQILEGIFEANPGAITEEMPEVMVE